jgi:hypothetical protein
MIPKQFKPSKPQTTSPKTPKVKNSASKQQSPLKPMPSPEEKALMLAQARNLDARTRKLNNRCI